MKNPPPSLDPQTRRRNAELAIAARRERSKIKSALKEGSLSMREIFDSSSAAAQRMRVIELLTSLPQMGPLRAESLMEKVGISRTRRIAGLGVRQRRELLTLVERNIPSKMLSTLGAMSSAFYGRLFVISGPGGVGKSTITQEVARFEDFFLSISVTTRPPRDGEQDGVHYHFVTRAEFEARIANNEFMEWAEFAGNLYGTLEEDVQRHRLAGKHVLLEIELQGARQVKEVHPEAVLVFISPPSWEELEGRIRGRGSDSDERIRERLAIAQEEMAAAKEFDHVLVNSEVAQVVSRLVALATS
ncbi:MAG: guanylate kinase [Actinobacteria bacterium]|uniref:guanylate kinase n=1 Tax=freshwater metagenome TaxID=449393 RepID=A0A6J6D4J2_9ZZZZ|nr:guanylate kinase [Actinomycetota bacterium]